jgi:transcription antitermination factor NusA-like protein
VQAIVNELYGERIDIIEWSSDVAKYVSAALQPARVSSVEPDPESKAAIVIVPDHQLSLAIGKHGQNVRLAARLTGWRIDIKSEQQVREAQAAEQQTVIRAAVSRQLSAKHYEPWGWAGHSNNLSHMVHCGPIPCVGESVFQAPWQA